MVVITESAVRDAERKMKEYLDPLTGSISYSGADFKAMVFLPVSKKQLQNEVAALAAEKTLLEKDLYNLRNLWTTLSSNYALALQNSDTVGAQYYSDQLKKLNLRDIETMREQLEVINEQADQLARVSSTINAGQSIERAVELGDVQTITISSFREKFPVNTLGRVHAKSFTRGPRTFAGSMIFTVINKHALYDIVQAGLNMYNTGVSVAGSDSGYPENSTMVVDQLPPFDIILVASNEIGDNSYSAIYGVDITNDGTTMSIQDILTEQVMQFYCRDVDPLRPLSDERAILLPNEIAVRTASRVLKEEADELRQRNKDSIDRQLKRLNPFV